MSRKEYQENINIDVADKSDDHFKRISF